MRIERTLFPPVPRRSQRGGWWVKSEIRNPKTEGNPKAEIRIHAGLRDHHGRFGLRISDLGLPSGFGFRVSDFIFLFSSLVA